MLKRLAALFLLLAFVGQSFQKSFIMLDYYTNTDAYVRYCINKAKLQLDCKGRCQVKKKIEQEEKKDGQNPERRAENKTEVLSSKSFYAVVTEPELFTVVTPYSWLYDTGATKDRSLSIFHPPGA